MKATTASRVREYAVGLVICIVTVIPVSLAMYALGVPIWLRLPIIGALGWYVGGLIHDRLHPPRPITWRDDLPL